MIILWLSSHHHRLNIWNLSQNPRSSFNVTVVPSNTTAPYRFTYKQLSIVYNPFGRPSDDTAQHEKRTMDLIYRTMCSHALLESRQRILWIDMSVLWTTWSYSYIVQLDKITVFTSPYTIRAGKYIYKYRLARASYIYMLGREVVFRTRLHLKYSWCQVKLDANVNGNLSKRVEYASASDFH